MTIEKCIVEMAEKPFLGVTCENTAAVTLFYAVEIDCHRILVPAHNAAVYPARVLGGLIPLDKVNNLLNQ
jgi:hypothetical protein